MSLFLLRNVNFKNIIYYPDIEIPKGSATFICGESGCGKSTLLKLLSGIASADDGEILYADKRITEYNPVMLRRDVLLCGQSAFLFDGSVQDNFAEYYKYRDLPPPDPEEINRFTAQNGIEITAVLPDLLVFDFLNPRFGQRERRL